MVDLRTDGRTCFQVRPLVITYDLFGYADASVLFEIGNTKVLVGATLQQGVPKFLKGTGKGWLTAEYSMLPTSTTTRFTRESSSQKRNSRSVEISRIIGRSLRSIVDLSVLGERTIVIDCDVLQADGGTRVACITAASLALQVACNRLVAAGVARKSFVKKRIAAISVGIMRDHVYLDLSQEEDNQTTADFNFILTQDGDIIEIQGTSEKEPISWEMFLQLKNAALHGVESLFSMAELFQVPEKEFSCNHSIKTVHEKTAQQPFFSLGNRFLKQKE